MLSSRQDKKKINLQERVRSFNQLSDKWEVYLAIKPGLIPLSVSSKKTSNKLRILSYVDKKLVLLNMNGRYLKIGYAACMIVDDVQALFKNITKYFK